MKKFEKIDVFVVVLLTLALGYGRSSAQNHSELKWETFRTEHFSVYYHQGLDKIAAIAADIAEEAYGPVTSLYGFEPALPVHLILRDDEDYANGITYYYENKIEIWVSSLDYGFRGSHDWLRDVIVHEFTHIVSLQLAMRAPRRIPIAYLQYIEYEKEARKDVLTGYPRILLSYPIPGTIVPGWFSEGVAQYQADGARGDWWDSHRDMLLRVAALNDRLLDPHEMEVFEKRGIENEMVYNHGYSFVIYIAETYGQEKLKEITRSASGWKGLGFEGALKRTLGLSWEELHSNWRESITGRYRGQVYSVMENPVEGKKLSCEGYLNLYPRWSPDDREIAYISNRGQDYGITGLYVDSPAGDSLRLIAGGASSSASWSPDGSKLVFARRSKPNRHGSRYWELYVYDKEKQKAERLTDSFRGRYPEFSPDGSKIAFVRSFTGAGNLWIMDLESGKSLELTHFDYPTQIYSPRWSPDGKSIVFSILKDRARDIGTIDADGKDLRYLLSSASDERDPCWTPDGKGILFSSDATGIFNIYKLSIETGNMEQLTNVPGGAFSPSISKNGEVVYSLYGADGYEIRILPSCEGWKDCNTVAFSNRNSDDPPESDPSFDSKPYSLTSGLFAIMPRVMIDYKKPKLGFYTWSRDVLDRQSIFGGIALAPNLDLDLFAIYEYKQLPPLISLEYYKQSRHISESYEDEYSGKIQKYDITYDLNEADLRTHYLYGGAHEFSLALIGSIYNRKIKWEEMTEVIVLKHAYFKGFDISFGYKYESFMRATDDEINPRGGRSVSFKYVRAFNYLFEDLDISGSMLKPKYKRYFHDRFYLNWIEALALPHRSTLEFKFKLGIADRQIDDFLDFHLGGIANMRGYTYYSLSGRKIVMTGVDYRFPIARHINRKISIMYFDKLYALAFADIGRAWDKSSIDFSTENFKKDAGMELRLDTLSFYNFPTRLSISAAYGFDEESGRNPWKTYISLLFGYRLETEGEKGGRR